MPVPVRTGIITSIVVIVSMGMKKVSGIVMMRVLISAVGLPRGASGVTIHTSCRCGGRWLHFFGSALGSGLSANVRAAVVDDMLISDLPQVPRRGRQQACPQSA